MENKEHVWHKEVISWQVERSLGDLRDLGVLDRCYLAGGTGLALHLGHRRSQDLDFFSSEKVEPETLIQKLQTLPGFALVAKSTETLHATLQGIKISFLGYSYPLLFPLESFLRVPIADPRDIACMKLSAIVSRAKKRDFIDLYAVAQQREGLRLLLQRFAAKYAQVHYNPLLIVKSLTYFEDAEDDVMPDMIAPYAWAEVKLFFLREAPRLL